MSMPPEKCAEYAELEERAHGILKKLPDLAQQQVQAIEAKDSDTFTKLDKELERTVGHKERTIGALRQHAADHGCQREFMPEL